MNKFHSTISRRDFMKGLGLAGAGLGAATAAAPVFHDLDEVASSPQGETKHPWYVKELEHEKPTVEIDWSVYSRFDKRIRFQRKNDEATALYAATRAWRDEGRDGEWLKEKFPTYKGPTLRDLALTGTSSASSGRWSPGFTGELTDRDDNVLRIPTPDSHNQARWYITGGFPKWSGTPEESMRTLRSACRFFGASEIGAVELTANTRKLIYANDGSGKPYNFKDADVPEVTDTEYVIPNKCKNVLFFSTLEATDQVRVAPAPTWSGYDHYRRVTARIHYFLGAMGYQHIDAGGITTSNSWGALSGVVEHSRAGHIGTSYKYGNMFRGMHRIITDFPLALTNPIDAGIAKFCEACKTCSESCPFEAMDLGDKSWEISFPDDKRLGCYIPGYKGWRTSVLKCPKCKNCHGTCPFNAADEAIVHAIIRATQATIPIFNGFFASMHRTFGYGTRNMEDWWERDVPTGFFDPAFIKA